jgi:glycosyltransferase involved in cell wall biosynthesis
MTGLLRVGLVCDLLEERWTSMDLVADHLHTMLCSAHDTVEAEVLRPRMRRRLTRFTVGRRIPGAGTIDRLVNRHFDYPRWLARCRDGFGVYHVVDHSYAQLVHALPARNTVVTCHDLDAFRCLLPAGRERRSAAFRALARRTLDGLACAARVVCDSEAVRRELAALDVVHTDRLRVVPIGVDAIFSPAPDPVGDAQAAALLGPTDPRAPELLHVGSTIPRKRLDLVLRAFAMVRRRRAGARLVRVGGPLTPPQQDLARALGIASSIVELPHLDTRTLAAVYRRASAVILPSDREGFGLPVLEALASGRPVVASDIPALRESGGRAACFCEPGSAEAFAERAVVAIEHPDAHRRDEGLRHAGDRTWREYARRMVEIYREVDPWATATQNGRRTAEG